MITLRNRFIAFSLRLLATGGVIALLSLYIASVSSLFWIGRFEIQVGFLYSLILLLETISSGFDLRHGVKGYAAGVFMSIKLPITVYAIMAGTMYIVFPFSMIEGENNPMGFALAVTMISFAIFDWIFIDEKGTVRYSNALPYTLYPALYLLFNIFRPLIFENSPIYVNGSEYPYPFLDPSVFEMPVLAYFIAILVIASTFVLAILLNDLLSGVYKKRKNN